MNVRIFWVRAMKCMCAQTRPRFILSSERVLGGVEFEPMLTPREKSPVPENVPRGGSNPRRCGQRAQALPTELFRPPQQHLKWHTSGIPLSNYLNFLHTSEQNGTLAFVTQLQRVFLNEWGLFTWSFFCTKKYSHLLVKMESFVGKGPTVHTLSIQSTPVQMYHIQARQTHHSETWHSMSTRPSET